MTKHSTKSLNERGESHRVAPAPKAPLLDLSTTYDHENPVTARVYTFLDGTFEMGYTCGSKGRKSHKKFDQDADGDHQTLSRARSAVRRLVLSLPGKAFLTLTYADNQTDYKAAKADLQAFVRRCRHKYGKFPHVAVAETQKRGAWHWHIVLDGFYPYQEIRELWTHGFIDIRKVSNPRKAANYIGKYLTKTFKTKWPAREPRYLRSRNIEVNTKQLSFKSTAEAKEYFYKLTDGIYSYEWEENGNGFITN